VLRGAFCGKRCVCWGHGACFAGRRGGGPGGAAPDTASPRGAAPASRLRPRPARVVDGPRKVARASGASSAAPPRPPSGRKTGKGGDSPPCWGDGQGWRGRSRAGDRGDRPGRRRKGVVGCGAGGSGCWREDEQGRFRATGWRGVGGCGRGKAWAWRCWWRGGARGPGTRGRRWRSGTPKTGTRARAGTRGRAGTPGTGEGHEGDGGGRGLRSAMGVRGVDGLHVRAGADAGMPGPGEVREGGGGRWSGGVRDGGDGGAGARERGECPEDCPVDSTWRSPGGRSCRGANGERDPACTCVPRKPCYGEREKPQHEVTVPGFHIRKTR
jgi:hypothetical protein